METVQVILTVSLPTLAVLVGMLISNVRLNDLRSYMGQRFSYVDQRFSAIDQRFSSIEQRFTEMDQRWDQRLNDFKGVLRADLRRVEEVMDARLTRIEQERKLR